MNELLLTAETDGTVIELQQGESITLLVDGYPSAGYMWSLSGMPDSLRLWSLGGNSLGAADEIGGGYRHTFVFAGVATGPAALVFEQIRPWLPGEAVDTRRVMVNVIEKGSENG